MTDTVKMAYINRVAMNGLLAKSALEVGVSIEAARKQRRDDEEFGKGVDDAMEFYRDSIEGEIHRRGIEGVREPVFFNGRQCGTVRKYSDKLLEMHAKRHIKAYKDHLSVDAHVTGGLLVIPAGPQSVEDWENKDNTKLEVIDVTEVEEIEANQTDTD